MPTTEMNILIPTTVTTVSMPTTGTTATIESMLETTKSALAKTTEMFLSTIKITTTSPMTTTASRELMPTTAPTNLMPITAPTEPSPKTIMR